MLDCLHEGVLACKSAYIKKIPLLLALTLAVVTAPPDMCIKDVAIYLGVTTKTVQTMIADGRLRAYRIGDRIIRFRRSEVDAALTPTDV